MSTLTNLQKARARLLLNHPFFATLLLSTPMIECKDIPTAATDMKSIMYNPDFFAELSGGVTEFVLAHEVSHIIFEHGLRLRGRDPRMWNVACDYAINWILKDSGFELYKDCLISSAYANMSAEQIYEILQKKYPPQPQPQDGNGQPAPSTGSNGLPQDGLGQDVREPQVGCKDELARVQRSIQQRVAQAATIAKMAGRMSATLERFVNEILNPTVPWPDLLRDYMTRTVHDDENWSRRNRRLSDVYLPARHSQRMGEIVVIGDVSGSVGQAEFDRITAEITGIAEMMLPERVRVVWADTQVVKEETFECGEPLKFTACGGGGTDMRVPLNHVLQYDPQIVVLITDGYSPWPEVEPDYPLIVCCTTDYKVPVGQVVRV